MGASAFPVLGFDPCPGDPDGVMTLAGKWQDAAFLLSEIAVRLDRTDPIQNRWKGKAADAFRTRLDAHRIVIGKFRACCDSNVRLLKRWEGELLVFQTEAARLEAQANAIDEQRRRRRSPMPTQIPDLVSGPTPRFNDLPSSDHLQAQLSGVRRQAEELHARYLHAARILARHVSALLTFPSGTSGWFGQDIDSAEEAKLLSQESHRKGGVVPIDPALRTAWWNSLSPDEQAAVARDYFTDVDSTNGLPADVADQMNRLRLQAEARKPDCPQRLKDLWTYLSDPTKPDMYLLGYDNIGNGHVVVSFGNPDTAPNTAVYVPGTGSSLDGASGDLKRALTLYTSTNSQKPDSTASVYWLGYDAPGWSYPGPASQSFADAGAPKLAAFVNSLAVNHSGSDHVTVIGHSYGSTLVGDAFARRHEEG